MTFWTLVLLTQIVGYPTIHTELGGQFSTIAHCRQTAVSVLQKNPTVRLMCIKQEGEEELIIPHVTIEEPIKSPNTDSDHLTCEQLRDRGMSINCSRNDQGIYWIENPLQSVQ